MSRHLDLMRQGFMHPAKPAKLTKQQKQDAKEQEARILARLDEGERRREMPAVSDLQRQLSEAQTLELEHQATIRHLKTERDDYLNKALMADLDRQAAIDRHAELVECLETGEAFGFDPATGFGHADDGGAPESCVFYVPKASTTAAEADRDRYKRGLETLACTFYKDDQYQDYAKHILAAARAALQGEPKP